MSDPSKHLCIQKYKLIVVQCMYSYTSDLCSVRAFILSIIKKYIVSD